jgi:hypothetical protein
LFCCTVFGSALVRSDEGSGTIVKTERFDRDPGWDAYNNRVVVEEGKTVVQDFGYSSTNFAGKAKGEIGGEITRASKPAYYGVKITPKTLNDKLSASGTFAVTECHGAASVCFGWFSVEGRGAAGRPMNALALEFAGERNGPRLTVRLTAASNRAVGQKVTPFINDRKVVKGPGNRDFDAVQPDGTRYTWTLDYEPTANGGNGRIEFVINGNAAKHQPWEGKPLVINIPAEVRQEGATFDHFGLLNGLKPGGMMKVYFDDLVYDGVSQDFSRDPRWDEIANRDTHEEREGNSVHDFGFSATTTFAGGSPGEIGGILWRGGDYAYYADRLGPLSLDHRLEASGKVSLEAGPSDSTIYLGWFNSAERENSPVQAGDFLGITVGGPSQVGHYFLPSYATTKSTPIQFAGKKGHPENVALEPSKGPVLIPQRSYAWTFVYDPKAEDGRGTITATLGSESITFPLKKGDKEKGAKFDRFGLFTKHHGGNFLKIYFDDLNYTSASRLP